MQEKDGHGRSPVSQDPSRLGCGLCASPEPAASPAVGGLHFAGRRLSLSRAFTFNCCSGLRGAAGFGPHAQCSVLAHFCSHQQGLTFHQVALLPGAQEPSVCVLGLRNPVSVSRGSDSEVTAGPRPPRWSCAAPPRSCL